MTQKNTSRITSASTTVDSPTRVSLKYDESSGYPYKATMENEASSWLIYNQYDSTDDKNEFEVEFLNDNSGWAGVDEANSTSNTNGASKTNRRIMW